jgi:hypothetical protein
MPVPCPAELAQSCTGRAAWLLAGVIIMIIEDRNRGTGMHFRGVQSWKNGKLTGGDALC